MLTLPLARLLAQRPASALLATLPLNGVGVAALRFRLVVGSNRGDTNPPEHGVDESIVTQDVVANTFRTGTC